MMYRIAIYAGVSAIICGMLWDEKATEPQWLMVIGVITVVVAIAECCFSRLTNHDSGP